MRIQKKILSKTYVCLLILTMVSALLAEFHSTLFADAQYIALILVLLIVAVKGQQIVSIFMELNHAPSLWRKLLFSYVILLPLIIGLIYI